MAVATASDLILSIRTQIPDRTKGDDASLDGTAFTAADLLRWINDAGRLMCLAAPIIQDWYAISSASGQDVYELPQYITTVEQVWYDQLPLTRNPEAGLLYTSKPEGNAWWFGPHSIHATPRLFMWPAPSRTAASTILASGVSAGATSLSLTSGTNFRSYGFLKIGGSVSNAEVCRYATINTSTGAVSNLLKGQGGTKDQTWASDTTVDETNIFFKCYRLPRPLEAATDPLEIPQGLWPLVEIYVLSKVRNAEQDDQGASQLRQEFSAAVEKLGEKSQLKGLRQGIQVRTGPAFPHLFQGRIFVP